MQKARTLAEHLLPTISRVSKIIDPKITQEVLRRVRIQIDDNGATVSAINLNEGFSLIAPLSLINEGTEAMDFCVDPMLTEADVPHACTIEHDGANVTFRFGMSFAEPKVRIKRPTIAGKEFPVVPNNVGIAVAQIDAEALTRAVTFAAAASDASVEQLDRLHVQIGAEMITIKGANRSAVHRALVPCTNLVDRDITFAATPKALLTLCKLSTTLTLSLDDLDQPQFLLATLDHDVRAVVNCSASTINIPAVPTDHLWCIGVDPVEVAMGVKGAKQRDRVAMLFAEDGSATLELRRQHEVARTIALTITGSNPGERQIVIDATVLRDAIQQLGKVPRGKRKKLGALIELGFDAMHRQIIWQAGGMVAMHQLVEPMFPLEMPENLYKNSAIFGWQGEESKQEEDRRAAQREYEQWIDANFSLEQRVEMRDRHIPSLKLQQIAPLGLLGTNTIERWGIYKDDYFIAAYEHIYLGTAAPKWQHA